MERIQHEMSASCKYMGSDVLIKWQARTYSLVAVAALPSTAEGTVPTGVAANDVALVRPSAAQAFVQQSGGGRRTRGGTASSGSRGGGSGRGRRAGAVGGVRIPELPALGPRPSLQPRVRGRQLAPWHAPLPVHRTAALPGPPAEVAVPELRAARAGARQTDVHDIRERLPPPRATLGTHDVLGELAPIDLVAVVHRAAALAGAAVRAVPRGPVAASDASLPLVEEPVLEATMALGEGWKRAIGLEEGGELVCVGAGFLAEPRAVGKAATKKGDVHGEWRHDHLFLCFDEVTIVVNMNREEGCEEEYERIDPRGQVQFSCNKHTLRRRIMANDLKC